MPPSSDLGQALCIITGASRGFGRAVARDLSRLVQPGSVLVLAARSGDELRALQAELTDSEAGRAGLKVQVAVADVGRTEGLEAIIRSSAEAFSENIDRVILINNAGECVTQQRWRYFKNVIYTIVNLYFRYVVCN